MSWYSHLAEFVNNTVSYLFIILKDLIILSVKKISREILTPTTKNFVFKIGKF